jgi:integrase
VNRELGVFRQAYRLAVKQKRLGTHAVPYFPMLPEKNARQGSFEEKEFKAVVKRLPRYAADVLRFAYLTGWRKGEIVALGWNNVDRSAREIRLQDSKNGEGRVLAYDDELAKLIDARWAAREVRNRKTKETSISPLAFHRNGKPVGDFRKVWVKGCEAAKCPGKLFHDTRRSAVRNMVRAGVPQSVAMSISGHKTVSMFLRYKITSGDEQREALRRVREHLETAVGQAKVVPLKKTGQ